MEELLEFLIHKCLKGLEEATKNCGDTQLEGELNKIKDVLPKDKLKDELRKTKDELGKTKNELYNLISALTDINTPYKHPAQILCFPCQIRSRRQTKKNLQQIRTNLQQIRNRLKNLDPSEESLDRKNGEGGASKTSSRRWICKILPCLKQSIGQGTDERSPNQNGGSASSQPAGEEKEVSFEPEVGLKSEEKILGFDKLVKEIVGRLDFNNRSGHVEIGILGMCGSGKTTLAQRVYSHSSVDKGFKPQIWVSLPHVWKQRDFKQILRFILKKCGVYQSGMDKYEEPQLLRIVRENLLGKNYLLVLDGLWDADIEWYFELSKALDWQYKYGDLGDDKSKSAVIVITRQEEAAKTTVGISGLYQIAPLDVNETWSIFINKLNLGISGRHQGSRPLHEDDWWPSFMRGDAKEVKAEISKQCDGLPLAAVTLAEIFTGLIDQQRGEQSEVAQAVSGVEVVST